MAADSSSLHLANCVISQNQLGGILTSTERVTQETGSTAQFSLVSALSVLPGLLPMTQLQDCELTGNTGHAVLTQGAGSSWVPWLSGAADNTRLDMQRCRVAQSDACGITTLESSECPAAAAAEPQRSDLSRIVY